MLSLNNISIESILNQRNPMLMVDRVIDISEEQVCVKPKVSGFYTNGEKVLNRWVMLESMGQAAELLWRLKGMGGMGYLAKIDDYKNFPPTIEIKGFDFYIIAEAKNKLNTLCQSHIKFFYSQNEYASVKITHSFEKSM